MSTNSSSGNGAALVHQVITKFPDFDVSWAGQGRSKGEFCFGSADGRVLFTDEHLAMIGICKESPLPFREAINGLAFLNDLIALSTRCEVVFVSQYPVNGKAFCAVFPAGAHGVTATTSGYFVAPLGPSGIMVIDPSVGADLPLTIRKASHKPMNFYKVVNIPHARGEVLACAARLDGVAAMPFLSEGTALISSITYPELDVVDVCSLGHNHPTPAIAAVSRNCTLILSRDVLHDPTPTTIKFDKIKGVAYRVMNHDGNLLLLTSKSLYVIRGLSRRFLEGQPIALERTSLKAIPFDAVDANIVDDRYLLIVTPEGVIRLELDLLTGEVSSNESADEAEGSSPIELSPKWQPQTNSLEFESAMASAV